MNSAVSFFIRNYSAYFSLPVFVLLLFFHVYFGIIPGWKKITSDFPNYYVSAKMLREGKDLSCLYNNVCFNIKIKENGINAIGQFALYPPPDALIMIPVSWLDPQPAKRVWLCMNILFFFLCGALIKKITGWSGIDSLNTIMLSGFALANDFALGQVYLFSLLLLLSGCYFFMKGKANASGILWGVLAAAKYVPVIFLPALVLKKQYKTSLAVMTAFCVVHLASLYFFGKDVYIRFVLNVFLPHLGGNLYEGNPFSLQYQSWDSLLNNLFVFSQLFNPNPLIDSPAIFACCKIFLWLLVIGILIYFCLRFFKSAYFYEIIFSLSVISLLILEPGSATYHLLLMVFSFVLISRILSCKREFKKLFWLAALFALTGFLPSWLNSFPPFSGGSLLLSYHRLWLEMIFYFYNVIILYTVVHVEKVKA